MPFIPRRFAQSSGMPQEFMQPPREKPPLPKKDEPPEDERKHTLSIGMKSISPHSFHMPVDRVAKVLLGREVDHREPTGELLMGRRTN